MMSFRHSILALCAPRNSPLAVAMTIARAKPPVVIVFIVLRSLILLVVKVEYSYLSVSPQSVSTAQSSQYSQRYHALKLQATALSVALFAVSMLQSPAVWVPPDFQPSHLRSL